MGRNKTKRKTNQNNHVPDNQDPDVSETEPSSSENASSSLNDTIVLSSGNNVMDTDVEDSEQTTGNSTPADESDRSAAGETDGLTKANNSSDTTRDVPETEEDWDQPCPHIKTSACSSNVRKALTRKKQTKPNCNTNPCMTLRKDGTEVGSGDAPNEAWPLWICLQCGAFHCGDNNALNGDAEKHFMAPRSTQHNIVLKFDEELKTLWCFGCRTFSNVDDNPNIRETVHLIRRHAEKVKKPEVPPTIALGPPPPPPQPQLETPPAQMSKFKFNYKNKTNGRNRGPSYANSWDNSPKDDLPLLGLDNLGNTCFMNSALQCLSKTKSLIPKLDLYGTGNTLEILVTADPPSVDIVGTVSPDTNGEHTSTLFQLGSTDGSCIEHKNGDENHIIPSITEIETGGSSPSSSDMDSLLDVVSGTSSKSSPTKELIHEHYRAEIEKELKRSLRLKLVIGRDSMTSRLRTAFKAMAKSDVPKRSPNTNTNDDSETPRVRNVFTPTAIHNAVSKHFRPGQQHDSHELLRTLVDMMKKDQVKAFRLAIMQCYGIKRTEGKNCDPKVAELLKMWDRKLYHKTFVDEVFGGELVTFSKCLTCGSVRRSYEDFLDLSLPIRAYSRNQIPKRTYSVFDDDDNGKRSLEDCLKSFTEPEQLTGSNVVECENCHRTNLEKLEAGASFEEVFPGMKPPCASDIKKKPLEPEPETVLETEMDAGQSLLMDEETPQNCSNGAEDMDDLDEPAVDGIIANTSDMEDEGNDVPPIFLDEDYNGPEVGASSASDFAPRSRENMYQSLAGDEGFSESDSSEEKKSASISASSSRNSISEAENGMSSIQSKEKEVNKPIPITKCPCSRHQMVLRPPECLTVHLKRFQITSHGTSKLSDRVNFPYILNLTPFCARDDEDLQRLDGKDVYDEDGEVKYALYGIVEHSGSLHWGHYIAYIKVPGVAPNPEEDNQVDVDIATNNESNKDATADQWFYASDSSIAKSTLDQVLRMDPYILFYERIRGQDKKEKLSQLQGLHNNNQSQSESSSSFRLLKREIDATTTETATSNVAGCSFDFSTLE